MDNISVIIRNKNEQEYIGFAIQSVIDSFNEPEIIIVDNYSTDDSLEIVNLFIDRANIKIIKIDDYTPGKSINLGVKHATHNTILVLSAHAQITKVDVTKVNKILKNHKAVMGQQNPIYKGKKISKRYIWSHFGEEPCVNMYSKIENRPFLHNAFCFYTKDTLTKYPMPENYPGKEDRYWAIELNKIGYTYWYAPEFKCNHFYTGNGATWKGIG
tara:strand:- start:289 stop:930 length:642 start_codon:yes stop_codon:yes gene_type:complete